MDINFIPSDYQWQIFSFVQSGDGHAVIEAVAGSGKTTTIVTATQLTSTSAKIGFVAFNRHIARELERKAPYHVHVSTLHSLGLSDIRNTLGNVKVDGDKLKAILATHSTNGYDGATRKLVSLCKANLLEPTHSNLEYISSRWDVDVDEGNKAQVFEIAKMVYHESIAQTSVVDFDDMIFMPATGRTGCEQFDVLFVDELQDLNRAQTQLALRSVTSDGRIIGAGDPQQSIYGFRGADVRAIPNIIEALDAQTLPLSITYRCPQSHVRLAQKLVPHIEAAPDAEEGIIEDVERDKFTEVVQSGDMVLCRCNAPLVRPALDLIRQGKKAVILGRDIGKNLMALLRKVQRKSKAVGLHETLWKLREYADAECAKLYVADKAMRAQSLRDRVDTIVALSDGCMTIGALEAKMREVFSDEQQGVSFSTVHKAKGLEANRVFILEPGLMPHPAAKKEWEQIEELHVKYVAGTRSKAEMYFVR